jgi:enamine deaminase RidA (YjgF/YER057c/UK114 family)
MQLDVRGVQSPQAMELYVTAIPTASAAPQEQAGEVFSAIRKLLAQRGGRIFQERVFASASAVDLLRGIRSRCYGDLDDAVSAAWLAAPEEAGLVAVQVHAVCGGLKPRPIRLNGSVAGRALEVNGCRWITASGLCAKEAGDASAQTRASFEKAEAILKQAGGDMRSIARTWIFMDDILSWYDQFNQTRTGFFVERGVLGNGVENRMPASTGIGVSPAGGGKCLVDLFAVVGGDGCIQRHHAAGKQRSAFEYGSAFARASLAKTPAGRTVFVSGTAAIDTAGKTCFVNDISGQIRMTMENVNAVLRDTECRGDEVVQAIAYCATAKVKEAFEAEWRGRFEWPWVTLIGEVCRDDLLFEVEVTACPGAKRM